MKDILVNILKVLFPIHSILEGDTLYKSIYWYLYTDDNFISIEECKTVNIVGLTQHINFYGTFYLYNSLDIDLFMDILNDSLHQRDNDEYTHCIIIKYSKD